MKKIFPLLLTAALFTACSKKEADPQPNVPFIAPIQAATIDIVFTAASTAGTPGSTQSVSLLAERPKAQRLSDRLTLVLGNGIIATNVDGSYSYRDEVQLTIPLNKQKNGLVGTYTIASQPNTSLGEVLVGFYRKNSTGNFGNDYSSNSNRLEGSFVITAYDANRNLISGTYSLKFLNVKTPFVFRGSGSGPDTRPDGDLGLSGVFTELPL